MRGMEGKEGTIKSLFKHLLRAMVWIWVKDVLQGFFLALKSHSYCEFFFFFKSGNIIYDVYRKELWEVIKPG